MDCHPCSCNGNHRDDPRDTMNTGRRGRNARSAAVSAEDQPQRPRNRAGTGWNPRRPLRSTCCGWCPAHTAALREKSSRAAKILRSHGRPARPASNSSAPILLPKIPLPNSDLFTSGSVPRRQPNHACPSAPAARTPGAGRWPLPPRHSIFSRCDRGPVAPRFGCGSTARGRSVSIRG